MGQPLEGQRKGSMQDIFPDVSPERVKGLIEVQDYRARRSLMNLYTVLSNMDKKGQDVSEPRELLSEAYQPAMVALMGKLFSEGWGLRELSAADLLEDKAIVFEVTGK